MILHYFKKLLLEDLIKEDKSYFETFLSAVVFSTIFD